MLSEVDTTVGLSCPAPFNLAAYVLARSAELPDKTALQILRPSGAERWSYGRLARAVRGVAQGLRSAGLAEGDMVLLRLGNGVAFPLAFLGAVAANLLPVATPAALTEAEVSRIAADLLPAAVIGGPGISLPMPCPRLIPSTALRAMAEGPEGEIRLGDPNRPAYLVYTSGTSGRARAVVHAHRAIWARRMMWDGWYGLRENDRLLHAGALNWTFTLWTGLFDPWAAGATALIPEAGTQPEQLPLLLKRFDASLFAAAPGLYRQMLKPGLPLVLPRLRHGLVAGEKLPDALRADWLRATGKPLHEAFGLSECSTFLSGSPDRPAPPGATGYAQPGRRIAVLGADGQPVPRETPGTLAVHRNDPGLFLTYQGADAEAAAKYAGDWFLTGDLAQMRADGAVTYLGRADDMMNAGGFRVSPLEVEVALA
ncbi:MAG: AMP-binding protein, partial [Rhodobacteraceae bacterium]|nr:AMP-binding protein [Paracoccaceae bacterium]